MSALPYATATKISMLSPRKSAERWDEVVNARALAIAAEVRASHPAAAHQFSDHDLSIPRRWQLRTGTLTARLTIDKLTAAIEGRSTDVL
jgi:hypothetical protein